MGIKLNKIIEIFNDKNHNNNTTETKVLLEIDNILKKGKIDNIKTRDDFIRYLFNTYYYTSKYKPFISYLEIISRYYIIILILLLIGISFFVGLKDSKIINLPSNFDYKGLWLIFSNIAYFSVPFYIIIRIYYFIRKLLRNEVNNKTGYVIIKLIIKIILLLLLIPLTWFIGQFIASIFVFLYISFSELLNYLQVTG